jgi:2',3'-cyclic-nucleotide 2'-phosphodiesterase (5'-nucleotidase family)
MTTAKSWIIGADGSNDYTFTGPGFNGGEKGPSIYLERGQQYKFTNTMNAHPFRVQTTPYGTVGPQYNAGITNNDVKNGTLTWDVPLDAPSLLYYQCTAHYNMGGTFYIVDNSATGAQSSGNVSTSTGVTATAPAYTLQILHYYGESGLLGIQTAPIMGALIDKFDDQYANTLVIGEGDSYIPGPWLVGGADPSLSLVSSIGSTALARPDISIMNIFGTDVSALGNHEFDLGSPVLQGAFAASGTWKGAQFPFVTSNLDFSADSSLKGLADSNIGGTSTNAFAGKEAIDIKGKITPYTVVSQGGEKIGIVGATTWDLLIKSSPNGTIVKDDKNPSTSPLQEVAASIQASVNELNKLGVNKIVMVDQLDGLIERNKALAPLLSGVDVMVAGGGHERLGDSNDKAVAFNGHDANFIAGESYPIIINDKDGNPTLLVTTDTEYTYLGRLVIGFDAAGKVITSALDSKLNGAYAATEENLKAAYASSLSKNDIVNSSVIGKAVTEITTAIDTVISSKDSKIYGYSNVYLEGDRVFGRAQEVNLGNLTADANIYAVRNALGTDALIGSLKNGGGLRASIGSVAANGSKTATTATNVKPAGAISQLDIENALRFDNKLMVFDSTPQQLLNILDFAAGISAGNGGYAQIGGIRFSFDPTKASGSRVQDAAIYDLQGNLISKILDNGKVLSYAPAKISMVTLNFLANGGDGYPIKANATNFRYILNDGTLSSAINTTLDFTAATNVPSNALGEQVALQNYLRFAYPTNEKAFSEPDTPSTSDQRIQNLTVKTSDTVFPADLVHLRFVDPISGIHHFASNSREITNLLSAGWKQEGTAWNLLPSAGGESGGLLDVHRLYNPNSKDHLLTTNDLELISAQKVGYIYEGIAGRAYSPSIAAGAGLTTVQRYFNPKIGEHFYTSSTIEIGIMGSLGYSFEGAAWAT